MKMIAMVVALSLLIAVGSKIASVVNVYTDRIDQVVEMVKLASERR